MRQQSSKTKPPTATKSHAIQSQIFKNSLYQMSELLLQSPPGQINEVYNDLVQLTTVDKSMFKKYNLDQNIPILLKPENHTIVLGKS